MPDDLDFDALGAQYREARASIGVYRHKQAQAELAYTAIYQDVLRRGQGAHDSPELAAAQDAVVRAVADIEWCKAVTVASGEAFKGESFEVVLERNRQATSQVLRNQAEAALERGDTVEGAG